MNQYEKALQDADVAISLAPDWPKGYFRRGRALAGLKVGNWTCCVQQQSNLEFKFFVDYPELKITVAHRTIGSLRKQDGDV